MRKRSAKKTAADAFSEEPDDRSSEVYESVCDGDVRRLRRLIKEGVNVSGLNIDDISTLQQAAEAGHRSIVLALLDTEDISSYIDYCSEPEPSTALGLALINGHKQIAVDLLNHGADPLRRDWDKWTAIHVAAHCGCMNFLSMIIEKVQYHEIDEYSFHQVFEPFQGQIEAVPTPLVIAAGAGYLDIVDSFLRDAEVSISESDDLEDITPIEAAAASGRLDVIQVLLKYGKPALSGRRLRNAIKLAQNQRYGHVAEYLQKYAGKRRKR